MANVYIDFKKDGFPASTAPWDTNLITSPDLQAGSVPLIDENELATGYTISATSGLGADDQVGGATVITNNSGVPDNVVRSYVRSAVNQNLVLTIAGLDPNQNFTLSMVLYAYSNTRHTDASVNGSAVQRYLVSQSEINPPVVFSGSANGAGEVVITLAYVDLYSHIGSLYLVTEEASDTLTTDETECSYGSSIGITTSISGVSSATLQDSSGNTLQLDVVSDSQLTVPALAHGVDGILIEDNVTITVSDGVVSASSSINFVAPTGYELTTLTSIVDRDLIESDWIYPLVEAASIGDQSLKLVSDSFVTHNADGSSTITNSGTYTYYTIDATDGVVTGVTRNVQSQGVIVDSGYNPSNPPGLIAQMVGKNGASMWEYDSADSPADVRKNGYITNGVALGMKVGDVVTQIDTVGATVHHMYTVKSLNSDGSVNLSDGTAIN